MTGYTLEEARRQVDSGWASLLDEVYAQLPPRVQVVEIKEKFGALRINVDHGPIWFFDYLGDIEDRSTTICELCGKPGELRPGGWVKTLCDECYRKL